MGAFGVFLLTVLVFGVMILVHELGHFIACRIFGVRVNEFALGMGPKLFSVKSKKSGTVYSLRAFPVGGFNDIEYGNEEITDEQGVTRIVPMAQMPSDAFPTKAIWKRMIIIVAGAFMNLLLGFIIMTVVVLGTEKYASTTVAYFVDGDTQIAEYQGLMAGDEIVKIGRRRVHTGDELIYAVFADGAGPVDIKVLREGKELTVEGVEFPTQEKDGITYGIINFRILVEEKNFVNTVKQSFYGSINAITQVFDSLVGMVTGKYGLRHISGPIGVSEVIGQAAEVGLNSILSITVVLTMNLGIFNLLPIPGLDGAKLLFLAIEGIRKKPVPRNVEEIATVIGVTALMALLILVAFKDVFALIL